MSPNWQSSTGVYFKSLAWRQSASMWVSECSITVITPEAPATNILLNRTPRVYQTEPPFAGKIPRLQVRVLRTGKKLIARLQWDDATKNAPQAPPRKTGERGDPERIYKRPTTATSNHLAPDGVDE